MKLGYARVSTKDQNLDLQLDALIKAGCTQPIYQEKISTRKSERPEFNHLLSRLMPGDTVVVWKLDRLARDLKELIHLVEHFHTLEVNFISLSEQIDTSNANGRLTFHIFCSVAQFERDVIRERTLAGMEAARVRGKLGGRTPSLTDSEILDLKKFYADKTISIKRLCDMFGIKRTTLYKYVKN